MSDNKKKAFISMVFAMIGSILIGYGSNWMVGTGVFFLLWSVAGFIEFYLGEK